MDDSNNHIIFVLLFIMFVAIVSMVVLYIAGDLHAFGSSSDTETFSVSDPSSNKVCTLDYAPDGSPVVQYYNGTSWKTLTETTHYTISGKTVTVKASAMD